MVFNLQNTRTNCPLVVLWIEDETAGDPTAIYCTICFSQKKNFVFLKVNNHKKKTQWDKNRQKRGQIRKNRKKERSIESNENDGKR